jgi:tRNA/tmRNA/rRNA uracil-C5-methylase (TrmA/RlmC/RlmD family)
LVAEFTKFALDFSLDGFYQLNDCVVNFVIHLVYQFLLELGERWVTHIFVGVLLFSKSCVFDCVLQVTYLG